MIKNFPFVIAAAIFLFGLAACGGGDDGTPQSTVAPQQAIRQPVRSVPPSVYVELRKQEAFQRLNAIRQDLGLGLIAQNQQLDRAAQAHANYIFLNNEFSHDETSDKQGYTGADAMVRADAAGYLSSRITEVITYDGRKSGAGQIDDLMNSVYHRAPFVDYTLVDVGIGERALPAVNPTATALVLDFGIKFQSLGQGAPLVPYVLWPKNGMTVPALEIVPELPTPPGRGYPVSISFDKGKIYRATKFEMREAGSVVVPAYVLTNETDKNLDNFPMAALVAVSPLKPKTNYTVTFEGFVDEAPLAVNWSFETP